MAVWSKGLPLTASCLPPLPGVSKKVASDLGLVGGFHRVSGPNPESLAILTCPSQDSNQRSRDFGIMGNQKLYTGSMEDNLQVSCKKLHA